MADGKAGAQEKTEQPTEKKLADARKQGDVWQSQDFTTTVAILVFTLAAVLGAKPALAWMVQVIGDAITTATRGDVDVMQRVRSLMATIGLWSVATCAVAIVINSLVSAVQVGGVLSFSKLKPDVSRLNPIEGLKRIFAWRTVIELLRLIIKSVAIGIVLWTLAKGLLPVLARAQYVPLPGWLLVGGQQLQALLMLCCLIFGVLAIADLFYQRWDYTRRHKMSKEEVRREYKEREGDPILRGRRKHLHQEIVFSDMLQKVRTASVVVVNPTHVAVALHYDALEMPIPMVVAKGEGEVARAIREAAEQAGVPIYRDVSLARALQGNTPINDYIPDDLMVAVAQVLRWVERMKQQEAGRAP